QHVESRSSEPARAERVGESPFVDEASAGGVQDNRAERKKPELSPADQTAGLFREWNVEREDIGRAQQLVEACGSRLGDSRVVGEHAEAQGPGATGHRAGYAPEPDE